MKSEMTNTSDRRRMVRSAASSSAVRSVSGASFSCGWGSRSLIRRSTWSLPPRAGITPLHPVRVQDRAHPVAVAGEQPGQDGHEVDQQVPLQGLDGAEVHRWAQVQQEPRRHLAVLDVLADVGRLHARGDVPVDVADVVAELVLAQVGQLQTEAAEQRPVVALEQSVQPANHRPVQALQDLSQDYCADILRCSS